MAVPKKHKEHAPTSVKCGVITISDSRTPETDESGKLIRDLFQRAGHSILFSGVVDLRGDRDQRRDRAREAGCDDPHAPSDVRARAPRFRRTLPFPIVREDRQRGHVVRCSRGRVPRAARVLSPWVSGCLSLGDGEADPAGARSCRRSHGPMRRGPAHTHGPREQAHGMRSLKTLIPFEDARRMALDLVRPIDRTEIVRLLDASGRVAAEDVRSRIDVPLADRAGMDGYAVVARDTAHATKSRPAVLRRLE